MNSLNCTIKSDFKDLRTEVKVLCDDILRIDDRIKNLEVGQLRIESKLDYILDTLVSLESRVEDHETRMKKIESSKHIV